MATSEAPVVDTPKRRTSRTRLWLFRLTAVALGLLPFVAFEGVCTLFDWGRPSLHDDPFVGFRGVVGLFVLNDDLARYEIPKGRLQYFAPESFPAKKAANEYRVFCLGGSTVQGNPYSIPTSFTTWLEISLTAADPSRRWEVVNCGGVSYASYRLVPILQEVLASYQPDLIVLYTGQNEFLESRSLDHIESRGGLVNASLAVAARARTFTLAREACLRLAGHAPGEPPAGRQTLPTEVDTLLDYRGGLEEYHRDDAWRRGVIAQYRFNVRRMVEMARAAGVDMILCNPVCNLSDSPPFKCEHRADIAPRELAEWESTCDEAARLLRAGGPSVHQAARLYERACRIDPLHAGAFYNLAKCYEAAGRFDEARTAYIQAKELDVCPLRVLSEMNEAVLEIARDTGTPLVDADKLFSQRSPHGIVGGQWLVDHVHPGIEGHQLLADSLADLLVSLGKVSPRADWQQVKQLRYREHLDVLDPIYYARGLEHLENLRGWANGRAERLRPASSPPLSKHARGSAGD
jgi:tetratricopeptide (TPR) repeat protein